MQKNQPSRRSHRPKPLTVFAAAFVAGAAAAVGVNRALDIHLAQAKSQVECEPIFVAIRTLPQGSPVTIWDVALRDWPKAMLPTTALRADDRFEGMILKHPLREGQPLLSVQLAKAEQPAAAGLATQVGETYVPATIQPPTHPDADLWTPSASPIASTIPATAAMPAAKPAAESVSVAPSVITTDIDGTPQSIGSTINEATVSDQTTPATIDSSEGTTTPSESDATAEMTPSPSTDAVVEPTPAQAASTPAKRYLVVPERIATLADTAFTTPAPQQPTSQTGTREEPAGKPQEATTARTSSPAVLANTQPTPRNPSPAQDRIGTPKKPTPVPRVTQAPTNRPRAQSSEPPRPQAMLGSVFPSLRTGSQHATRDDSSDRPGQPQTSKKPKPSSRTAWWPSWSSGNPASKK